MNKLVYLEELDSVRNTPEEIKIGQNALFEEIVGNGNKVVLSFNQVLDSRAFLCAIENEQQYEYMIELFKKGYLRFSSYSYKIKDGDNEKEIIISSASQYIQNAIQKALKEETEETYIFSGLPITNQEKELLELMNQAIQYSNPAILERYTGYKDDKERLDYLQRYIKTILQLSVERLANNPVKTTAKLSLIGFIEKILKIPLAQYFLSMPEMQNLLKDAFLCLDDIKSSLIRPNERSNWHKELKKLSTPASYMAEALVNIAYNYTVEDSIANVSKHYNDSNEEDFYRDFEYRFLKYWNEYLNKLHVLHAPDKSAHELYNDWKGMPHWATATRLVADEHIIHKLLSQTNVDNDKIYEHDYKIEKRRWGLRTIALLLAQFLFAILIAFVIHYFNEISGIIENFVGDWLSHFGFAGDKLTIFVSNFLIYTVAFGTLWSFLQMILKLPDIAENLKKLCLSVIDFVVIVSMPRKTVYKRLKSENKHE